MKVITKIVFIISLLFCINVFASNNLIGYWQNFTNPAETPVKLTDIPAGYNIVTVAFADMSADGTVSFTLQGPPYSTMKDGVTIFKNDIKILQKNGVKVLLSLGGQNSYYQINNTTEENNFIATLEPIMTSYGFDGLDYDLENGLTSANASYLQDATKKMKQDLAAQGKNLFITIAPETLDVYWQVFPNGKYDSLIRAGVIDLVQVQLYNSGCMPSYKPGSPCYSQGSEDFIVSNADSTIQTWKKMGIPNPEVLYAAGLPATQNAAGGGYLDPTIVKKALTCLQTSTQCDTYTPTESYPTLTNVMTWDINWDAKNNYLFEKTIKN